MNNTCAICGSKSDHIQYSVREMQFGTREYFPYFECVDCGCLQLAVIPADISRHYPSDYYSFSSDSKARKGLAHWLYHHWVRYLVTGDSMIGFMASVLKKKRVLLYETYKAAGMHTAQRILDIGSGAGSTLQPLRMAGFKGLMGSDEFIADDIRYDNGLVIRKANLFDIEDGGWDIIMFNHVFEHLPKQQDHLLKVHSLLKPGGTCIIRIPTTSSYAWEHYRENWAMLDAPRHFFLHSHKSITLLAEQTGFRVKQIIQESLASQFASNEQYIRDIPLFRDPRSVLEGNRALFSEEEWENFDKLVTQLNNSHRGDSIGVILTKTS